MGFPIAFLVLLTLAQGVTFQDPPADEVTPSPWPEIELLPQLVTEHGLGDAYRAFVLSQRGFVEAFKLRGLTSHTRTIFQDPLGAPAFAVTASDRIAAHAFGDTARLDDLLVDAGWLLDEELLQIDAPDVLVPDLPWRERLDRAQERLERAAALVDEAFVEGMVPDREAMRARVLALMTTFKQNVYPTLEPTHSKTLDDLRSLRTEKLLLAARLLAPLTDTRFTEFLYDDMRRDPPDRSECARAAIEGVEGIVPYHRDEKPDDIPGSAACDARTDVPRQDPGLWRDTYGSGRHAQRLESIPVKRRRPQGNDLYETGGVRSRLWSLKFLRSSPIAWVTITTRPN
ncbi:MAG: hypothetical protein H6834_09870 [Planctomycetes bacterium]|nr:hypothetical protein [Planctomycetota bacterium]